MDRFCIDTCSLIRAWREAYPIKLFPTLWERLEQVIRKGQLITVKTVVAEVGRQDDGLRDWIKKQGAAFVHKPTVADLARVQALNAAYPKLVDCDAPHDVADPFLIAASERLSATVVTEETKTGNLGNPHIPDVCKAESISCIRLLQLIERFGWRF